MIRRVASGLLVVLVLLAAAACGDAVEPAWRLERPRVLGASAAVVSDPRRSSPTPTEAVRVSVITASGAAPRGAFGSHAVRVCPSDGNVSRVACTGADLGFREDGTGPDPSVIVEPLGHAGEIVVFGMFCSSGAAHVDEGLLLKGRCDDGGQGQEFVMRVEVGGASNAQPELAADGLSLGGTAINEAGGCDSDRGLRVRADGASHSLRVAVAAASLEPGDVPFVSHLATHGDLDGLYTTLDAASVATVEWRAPTELGNARETARFHAVVRDGRGGAAFVIGAVCIER